MHTLEGLLKGIAADGVITGREMLAVRSWMDENAEFRDRHPFNEVMTTLDQALEDNVFDEDELKDVLWLCGKFTTEHAYFSMITSDMQRLQGILGGIAADGVITKEELDGLTKWMEDNEHLKGCWPFDELESLLITVLADGAIDENEEKLLQAFFTEFLSYGEHRTIDTPLDEVKKPASGVCAVCPAIYFQDRLFCCTGRSKKATLTELAEIVQNHGGRFTKELKKDVDYLVVGADGNPAWAFACYGRKVEEAMVYRKKGFPILLVHKFDFWDAVQDAN